MRYIATGIVHPERADVCFDKIKWELPGDGCVTAYCDSSQLTVVLELNSIGGLFPAFYAADHFASMVVGSLGFSLGSGYSVEIVQVIEKNGTPHVFGVRPAGELPDQTLGFEPNDPIFNRAILLSNQDVFFRLAIRDFLRGITDHIDCATYCYRAIESIKSSFEFHAGKDAWDDMHSALGTDRVTIENQVKKFADPVRHGNWIKAKPIDGLAIWGMLLLTKNILLKYLDYKMPAT